MSNIPDTTIRTSIFFDRFTDAEKLALSTSAIKNASIFLGVFQALSHQMVDLTDPILQTWMNSLVSASVLTSKRSVVIMTP
jgi:hypothetical protein